MQRRWMRSVRHSRVGMDKTTIAAVPTLGVHARLAELKAASTGQGQSVEMHQPYSHEDIHSGP